MSTHKKILSNAFAQLFAKILTALIAFVVVKIISGFGTEFYGHYVTAYEYLAFFGTLADAGLFAIAVREIAKFERKSEQTQNTTETKLLDSRENTEFILGNIFSMRLILIIVTMLIAGISAQFVPNYPPLLKIGIWITGLSMALTMIAGTLSAVLQARMKIQFFSSSLLLGKIILSILIWLIAWYWKDLKDGETLFFAFLWAGVLSNIVFSVLVFFFARREVQIKLYFHLDWWKKIFKISLPYGLALILQTLYLRVDIILISILLGASAVGVYGVSARIMESFLIVGVFFGQAIFPKISAEEHDAQKAAETLVWGMEKLLLFSLPILVGTFCFAPEIVRMLSTEEYLSTDTIFGADKALIILAPTVFFAYFNQLFSFSLVSKNQQQNLLWVNLLALILNVGLNLVFLKTYGIKAAAISTVFCEFMVFLLLTRQILKHFPLHFSWEKLGMIFGINGFLLGLILLTPLSKNLIISLALCVIIYSLFLWIFRKKLLIHQTEKTV